MRGGGHACKEPGTPYVLNKCPAPFIRREGTSEKEAKKPPQRKNGRKERQPKERGLWVEMARHTAGAY